MWKNFSIDHWRKKFQHWIYDPIPYAQEEDCKEPWSKCGCLLVLGSQVNWTLPGTPFLNFFKDPRDSHHSRGTRKEGLRWFKHLAGQEAWVWINSNTGILQAVLTGHKTAQRSGKHRGRDMPPLWDLASLPPSRAKVGRLKWHVWKGDVSYKCKSKCFSTLFHKYIHELG